MLDIFSDVTKKNDLFIFTLLMTSTMLDTFALIMGHEASEITFARTPTVCYIPYHTILTYIGLETTKTKEGHVAMS